VRTPRAPLTAVGIGAMAILGIAAVSGCSTPNPPLASATTFTPTAGGSVQPTATGDTSAPATPTVTLTPNVTVRPTATVVRTSTATPTATVTQAPTPTPRATATVSPTPVVTGAPQTGGGGTAGLQDGGLFALGGIAILAGAGSLGYRRRLARKH
jgi:hypothetical protein